MFDFDIKQVSMNSQDFTLTRCYFRKGIFWQFEIIILKKKFQVSCDCNFIQIYKSYNVCSNFCKTQKWNFCNVISLTKYVLNYLVASVDCESDALTISPPCVCAVEQPSSSWTWNNQFTPVDSPFPCILFNTIAPCTSQSGEGTGAKEEECRERTFHQGKARFPLPELTARVNSPSWRVTGFHYPSTRAVLTGACFH